MLLILGSGVPTNCSYRPRKRATTACEACRSRKTKCDNAKPSCRYCASAKLACTYTRSNGVAQQSAAPEPTNQTLLDRINHAISLIENDAKRGCHGASIGKQIVSEAVTDLNPYFLHDENAYSQSDFSDHGFGQLEVSVTSATTVAHESILGWPVLKDIASIKGISSFLLQSNVDASFFSPTGRLDFDEAEMIRDGLIASKNSMSRQGVIEDDIPLLSRKFLDVIHIRNPLLDTAEFSQYVREISGHGLGWDGRTCLVLLACALASIGTSRPGDGLSDLSEPLLSQTAGEAYYIAAKKRMGTLHTSLITLHCYCYAGLYENFACRPLRAWPLFLQAKLQLQAYLWRRSNFLSNLDIDVVEYVRHREQRLYWFCVKNEYDLRMELRLPRCSMSTFKYPDSFLSLSMPPSAVLGQQEENSWLFYLAEISLQRIMSRILDSFYSKGECHWITDIEKILKQHLTFKDEIYQWHAHLPSQIQFTESETPNNEFSFLLRGMYFNSQEWIYRPLIYYVICQPHHDPNRYQILPLAQKMLKYCTVLIPLYEQHHRHGRTWSIARRSTGCALLILASVRSQIIDPFIDWKAMVRITIQTLQRWENDAKDLLWAKQVLEQLFEETCLLSQAS
ncbi:vegetative cell wall protein gp1 [Bisporella sp. PMI_857]|nr:vegetative cell wall protein gp1 [Bisporella sp. PMI_857]